MDDFKKSGYLGYHIGPGGLKCPCCADRPPVRKRLMKRAARRLLKISLKKNWDTE